MRMSPRVLGLLHGGVEIACHVFPEGVVDLGVPHYAIRHNEEYYPDPFPYQPGRWIIEDSSKEDVDEAKNRV